VHFLSSRRRHPAAKALLLVLGLFVMGALYSVLAPAGQSAADTGNSQQVAQGRALFAVGCSSCHGLNGEGQDSGEIQGPPLSGVGAASVDFQVSTGRMPLDANGPQAAKHDPWFNQTETNQMAAYVASLAPGPAIPSPQLARAVDDPERISKGAELFRTNCAMCHNVVGAGGALTRGKYAPNLRGEEPRHVFEAMLTGPQSMPVFNDANISPEEKQDIASYLTYMSEAPSPGGLSLGSLGPVSEGLFAWAVGLTLLVGGQQVVVCLVKAAIFGSIAALIACYKGIHVGGGPAGVGNAVNETVVFTFVALFVINVLATAVAVKATS